jgi:hypothetical protein
MRRMVRRMLFVLIATLAGFAAFSLTATPARTGDCNDMIIGDPWPCQHHHDFCCNGECHCTCGFCQCGGICWDDIE